MELKREAEEKSPNELNKVKVKTKYDANFNLFFSAGDFRNKKYIMRKRFLFGTIKIINFRQEMPLYCLIIVAFSCSYVRYFSLTLRWITKCPSRPSEDGNKRLTFAHVSTEITNASHVMHLSIFQYL